MWEKNCLAAVGPIVEHASDGDSRRFKFQKKMMTSAAHHDIKFALEHEGFSLHGVRVGDDITAIAAQDSIHGTKKLGSAVASQRILYMGS
jgi:hypothetical protein